MTLTDYAIMSYGIGMSNGSRLTKSKFNPTDSDAFMRGIRVSFKLAQAQDSDADNADYKSGLSIGKRLAAGLKKALKYANYKEVAFVLKMPSRVTRQNTPTNS